MEQGKSRPGQRDLSESSGSGNRRARPINKDVNSDISKLMVMRDIESRVVALIRKISEDALTKLKESNRRLAKINAFAAHTRDKTPRGSTAWTYLDNIVGLSSEETPDDNS